MAHLGFRSVRRPDRRRGDSRISSHGPGATAPCTANRAAHQHESAEIRRSDGRLTALFHRGPIALVANLGDWWRGISHSDLIGGHRLL